MLKYILVITMNEKNYNSLSNFYKNKFGIKVFKVSIDAGFTCPNKDGSKGIGGCIFCNGSTILSDRNDDIVTQFEKVKSVLLKKWPKAKYIPFLEANTNTYGDIKKLKNIYEQLITLPNVVGLNIATRCDAITEETYNYLEDLSKKTYLTIELGLQSAHDKTLKLLNRGHTVQEFTDCVHELKKRNINVVVHIINGLPGEDENMMLENIKYINSLKVDGIKFHMLYIEENTKLANLYNENPFHLLGKDEYIKILGNQIALLYKNIVIHRLVSDPNAKTLIEPKWLTKKFELLNSIDNYLKENNIYQGQKK